MVIRTLTIVMAVIMMIIIIVTDIVFSLFFSSKQVRSVYINMEQNICFSVILKMRCKYVNDSKSPALLANTARPLQ